MNSSCLLLVVMSVVLAAPVLAAETQIEARISGPGISGVTTLIPEDKGLVRVTVTLKGDPKVLTPGPHGFHFHEVGV